MSIAKKHWSTVILETDEDATGDYVTTTEYDHWDVRVENNGTGTVKIQRGYQGIADDSDFWVDLASFVDDDGVLKITEPCQAIRAVAESVSGTPTIKVTLERVQR